MGLVYEQAVYAQLFKGHHIVLAALVVELFQLGLNGFLAAFQLLDGKPLSVVGFQLGQTVHDVPLLLFQDVTLALDGHGDFLKLRVTDDDGVVVAGGNAPAEPLAVFRLKIFLSCHQDVGGWIELQELRGPLFRQVVGHHIEGFLAQAQPLALHTGGDHFVSFARPHDVGQ